MKEYCILIQSLQSPNQSAPNILVLKPWVCLLAFNRKIFRVGTCKSKNKSGVYPEKVQDGYNVSNRKLLVRSAMVGRIWNRAKVSANLDATAVVLVAPVDTSLHLRPYILQCCNLKNLSYIEVCTRKQDDWSTTLYIPSEIIWPHFAFLPWHFIYYKESSLSGRGGIFCCIRWIFF